MAKNIFNSEVNKIRKMVSLFSFNLKSNGKQVILNAENQTKLKQATQMLEDAARILIEIK